MPDTVLRSKGTAANTDSALPHGAFQRAKQAIQIMMDKRQAWWSPCPWYLLGPNPASISSSRSALFPWAFQPTCPPCQGCIQVSVLHFAEVFTKTDQKRKLRWEGSGWNVLWRSRRLFNQRKDLRGTLWLSNYQGNITWEQEDPFYPNLRPIWWWTF